MVGGYQLDRRGVLRGAAIVVGSGLAGCSGNSSPDGGAGATGTTDEPEALPDAVYANVDDALVDLEAVQAAFAEEIEKLPDSLSYVAFETGPIRGDIEGTRASLDRAEEAAEEARPEGIETLWTITDYFERLVDGLARYDDGLDRLETAELYADNDRLEDGEAEAVLAVDAFEETVTTVEDAEAERRDIDLAPLDGLIEASPAQVRLALEETAASGDELLAYAGGLAYYVRGVVDYVVGLDHYQEGEVLAGRGAWDDAQAEYDTARDRFEAAHEESIAGEEAAPVPLLERFLTLTCESGHYAEAAAALADYIRARGEGDQAAEQAALEAWYEAEQGVETC